MNRKSEKARKYLKVTFETPDSMVDEAAGLLVSRGALGCAVERMQRSGARAPKVATLAAYFDHLSAAEHRKLRTMMAQAGMLADDSVHASATPERIVDPGWATAWKDRFEPFKVGRRLMIVPPWNRAQSAGRASIVIEPAQAFGTGHHPTTYGALVTLERMCSERSYARALDVGTGSGILAIAMSLMGLRSVRGIDVDPIAIENARENARLNGLEKSVRFSVTPVSRFSSGFDLVVANILSSTLIELAPALKRIVAANGCLLLGGILKREAEGVAARYAPELRITMQRTDRGWTTMVLER